MGDLVLRLDKACLPMRSRGSRVQFVIQRNGQCELRHAVVVPRSRGGRGLRVTCIHTHTHTLLHGEVDILSKQQQEQRTSFRWVSRRETVSSGRAPRTLCSFGLRPWYVCVRKDVQRDLLREFSPSTLTGGVTPNVCVCVCVSDEDGALENSDAGSRLAEVETLPALVGELSERGVESVDWGVGRALRGRSEVGRRGLLLQRWLLAETGVS